MIRFNFEAMRSPECEPLKLQPKEKCQSCESCLMKWMTHGTTSRTIDARLRDPSGLVAR